MSTTTKTPALTLFDQQKHNRRVHLLIPVTRPNKLFCKVLFSTLINAYPPPFLINYNQTFWQPSIARAAKIKGFRDYLVDRTDDDDVVIMIDGYDAWFQLPLDVLLGRFFATRAPVVFGADKKCWPNDKDSIACTVVPESPLPGDTFGKDTDKLTILRDRKDKYDNFRPRWVNSGTIIGYAKHVRSIYDEAWGKINGTREVTSDQLIMAEVFGDRIVRGDHQMTVDYTSDLFQTMTYSHNDVAFLVNPDEQTRSTTFSGQLSHKQLALEDLGLSATKSRNPKRSPWRGRNLAWNKVTNVIPTVLHFNGPKEFLDYWWPKMWWYPEGPSLRQGLLASTSEWKAGAVVAEGWLSWEALCGSEDLFDEVAAKQRAEAIKKFEQEQIAEKQKQQQQQRRRRDQLPQSPPKTNARRVR